MTRNLKVGIIGGGIFGLTAAIYLSKFSKKIIIFEKNSEILCGATKYNHNRHHYGFHYPRSLKTVRQCQNSKILFEKTYNKAVDYRFKNYYAISKFNSKIDPSFFENFCNQGNLVFDSVEAPSDIFNTDQISKCYLVNEGVYNFRILKNILKERVKKKNIQILTGVEARCFVDKSKKITIENRNIDEQNFDLIVNTTYDNLNAHIFNRNKKILMEYNLQEMCTIKINNRHRFGATVLDGSFPSILPYSGYKNQYLFAHAKFSQIIKTKSTSKPKSFDKIDDLKSNSKKIMEKSKKYLKILSSAVLDSSFFAARVVNIDEKTNSRKSEIIYYKNNNVSIFSGKVITSETIGQQLAEYVKNTF